MYITYEVWSKKTRHLSVCIKGIEAIILFVKLESLHVCDTQDDKMSILL